MKKAQLLIGNEGKTFVNAVSKGMGLNKVS